MPRLGSPRRNLQATEEGYAPGNKHQNSQEKQTDWQRKKDHTAYTYDWTDETRGTMEECIDWTENTCKTRQTEKHKKNKECYSSPLPLPSLTSFPVWGGLVPAGCGRMDRRWDPVVLLLLGAVLLCWGGLVALVHPIPGLQEMIHTGSLWNVVTPVAGWPMRCPVPPGWGRICLALSEAVVQVWRLGPPPISMLCPWRCSCVAALMAGAPSLDSLLVHIPFGRGVVACHLCLPVSVETLAGLNGAWWVGEVIWCTRADLPPETDPIHQYQLWFNHKYWFWHPLLVHKRCINCAVESTRSATSDHFITMPCSARKAYVLAVMWMSQTTHWNIVVDDCTSLNQYERFVSAATLVCCFIYVYHII